VVRCERNISATVALLARRAALEQHERDWRRFERAVNLVLAGP